MRKNALFFVIVCMNVFILGASHPRQSAELSQEAAYRLEQLSPSARTQQTSRALSKVLCTGSVGES